MPYLDYVWMAPEHLRETTPAPSVKGDVYSFGIILYEILFRCAPFENITLSPEGIAVHLDTGSSSCSVI